ncbi:MAG: PTS sugar transporter subunit IIC [Christensenellaceae bacterium]|jgi:uncharacterized membrane protein|nr:PTS sugar transporter subunit IIC [Christensenellaceae bacterium]
MTDDKDIIPEVATSSDDLNQPLSSTDNNPGLKEILNAPPLSNDEDQSISNIITLKKTLDSSDNVTYKQKFAVYLNNVKCKLKDKVFVKATAKKLAKRWFIDAFSGMALGLFATLIAGTIVGQIATLADNAFLNSVALIAKILMGAGIGAGIAHVLKADKLILISCMVAGMLGANGSGSAIISTGVGNPIGAYLAALITCEVCKLYAGKTKLDIILVPLGAIAISVIVVLLLSVPVNNFISLIAKGIAVAMEWNPTIMGIVIAVSMGLLLTLPTSSAAIWVMIASTHSSEYLMLAGGAAVVGCASHMIGFAVASFKENGVGGLIAQGLGTSMLQIPNLMKNPKILIPAVVASAVTGPLASSVFKLKCNASGGGMGTAGLVGVFGTVEASSDISVTMLVIGIILLFFIIPAVIAFFTSLFLRKIGWIKENDMKLNI